MKANVEPPAYVPSFDLIPANARLLQTHLTALIYLSLLPTLLYTLGSTLFRRDVLELTRTTQHLTAHQTQGLALLLVASLWLLINLGPTTYFLVDSTKRSLQPIRDYYRHGLRFSWRLLGYYIVYAALVFIGLLLLIVPGVIVLHRYFMGPYYLVDKDMTIKQAMTASATASKRAPGPIWGVIGVQVLFALVASTFGLVPAVGIILSTLVPYGCYFLPALRYRELAR